MTVWALKDPAEYPDYVAYVKKSLDAGESRFGWGYLPTADLRTLSKRPWHELTEKEKECLKRSRFLLDIHRGDWVVHINIPSYNLCTAAQVSGEYRFQLDEKVGDFGHCLPIDLSTTVVFLRNDPSIDPRVSQNLKPRQRFQRVSFVAEFLEAMSNLKEGKVSLEASERKGTVFLKKGLEPHVKQIAELIHQKHPGKALEYFLKDYLKSSPV